MNASELTDELVDRGIWWQVGGFTLVGCACAALLAEFAGSESRAFLYFEIAATKLYWSFVIPLAGLFDGVRIMFQKASERRARIRAQGIAEGVEIGREEGRNAERQYLRRELERLGVVLPPEAVNLFSEPDGSGR